MLELRPPNQKRLDDASVIVRLVRKKKQALAINAMVRTTGLPRSTIVDAKPLFQTFDHHPIDRRIQCVRTRSEIFSQVGGNIYNCSSCPLLTGEGECRAGQVVKRGKSQPDGRQPAPRGPFRHGSQPRKSGRE